VAVGHRQDGVRAAAIQLTAVGHAEDAMPYRMTDDSVTVGGKGHPEYSGKSITPRGEQLRNRKGAEPGRFNAGPHGHPEKQAGISTARDVSSVRPQNPISDKMPNLR
jgi:hypothetical protein